MLTELEPTLAAVVPQAEFAAHLRLGEGFGPEQGATLDLQARAAVAGVEAMTGLALGRRRLRWTITAWRDPFRVRAPISPIAAIEAVRRVGSDGAAAVVTQGAVVVTPGVLRPCVAGARGRSLPDVPIDGWVEIDLLAGFGPTWAEIPPDLRQAVLLLGAHYHEQRHVTADPADAAPFGVRAICARWREVRL